ncbi:DUF2059 domain-containing protein [Novosphingobium sp. MD-1]|uniref:DUF2059 domain-containing protein n=1 Tax=Novosphingobium sp. MD-1 TaxID=1630648 RepID=UPI00061C1238|nr:DUF2059 domain-containing protein [Novosphingobium sp. MD-1]GAO55085.1 hypothetical protein NMD1_02189 [Novosphingobium sp. MD-1]
MSALLRATVAAALLLSPATAIAQESPAPATSASPALPPVDPARLQAATATVDHIFPAGTYAKIMNGTMDTIVRQSVDSMTALPMRDLVGLAGLKPEEAAKVGKGTMAEVMAILDPAFRQRTDLSMTVMRDEMTAMMTQFEPDMRAGLAEAYARRFSAAQLDELNHFFATPTGSEYASNSMTLFMDPAVIGRMQALLPQIMRQMPAMIQKMTAATANLPKPRRYADLTAAERAQLARLLGLSEADLAGRQPRKGQ